MDDRETFEDTDLTALYRNAAPEPDISYRGRLRGHLATMPVSHRRRLPRFEWRWLLLSGAVATTVALVALILPLYPHSSTPASARAILEQVVAAAAHPIPYSGSAEIHVDTVPNNYLPTSTAHDVGRHRLVLRFSVRDTTHFRVESHTLQPALESQRQIVTGNGTHYLTYWNISARAQRHAFGPVTPAVLFSSVLTGGVIPPVTETVNGYLKAYNRNPTGMHAQLMGQQQVLGRTADIIDIHPIQVVSGETCATSDSCVHYRHTYGHARLWIDHAHAVVLRFEQYGVPAALGQNFTYRVTSITFGHAPTARDLAYVPPVPIENSSSSRSWLITGGASNGDTAWRPPTGFVPAGAPTDARGRTYANVYSDQETDPPLTGPSRASVIYAVKSTATTGPWIPGSSATRIHGPYVFVQERKRANGTPRWFHAGTPHVAGTCQVWTGRYTDGTRWIGLTKGTVSLLVTSNGFSQSQLVEYAAHDICG